MEQLGLSLTDDEVKEATNKIKALADVKASSLDDVDAVLRHFHEQKTEANGTTELSAKKLKTEK